MPTPLEIYNAALATAKADYDAAKSAKPVTAKAEAHETLRAFTELAKRKRTSWAAMSASDRAAPYNLAPRILLEVTEERLIAARMAFESRDYGADIFAVCRAELRDANPPASDTAGYDTSVYERMREQEGDK